MQTRDIAYDSLSLDTGVAYLIQANVYSVL